MRDIANDLEIPVEEINYRVAGINHMAFYLFLERDGEDLYPRLREFAKSDRFPPTREYRGMVDHVRYEILRRFGYFVTESSEHFSEYVPWFIKSGRDDLIKKFSIPLDEYLRRCEDQIAEWETMRRNLIDRDQPLTVERSVEFGPQIIHSIETNSRREIYSNVPNKNIIDNLQPDLPVEVPCQVDANGITPIHIGALPTQLAALMQTNINTQALVVEAALTGNRDRVYQAAALDPHTGAELDLETIWKLVDELIAAHGAMIPPLR